MHTQFRGKKKKWENLIRQLPVSILIVITWRQVDTLKGILQGIILEHQSSSREEEIGKGGISHTLFAERNTSITTQPTLKLILFDLPLNNIFSLVGMGGWFFRFCIDFVFRSAELKYLLCFFSFLGLIVYKVI